MSPELPWMRAGLLHATEKRWTKKNVETILQSNSSTAGVFKFPCNHQLMMIHIDTVLMLQVSVWLIDLSYVYTIYDMIYLRNPAGSLIISHK